MSVTTRFTQVNVIDSRTLGRSPGQWEAVLASWVAASMVIVIPLLLIRYTPTPAGLTWCATLVVTTVAGVRYAWLVGTGVRRPVEMSFWVFTYVFLGLAPLAQLRMEQIPDTTPRVDPTLNPITVAVVIVGVMAFVFGLAIGGVGGPQRARARREIDPQRALALGGFALLASAYYIAKVGVGTLFSTRDALYQAVSNAWPEPWSAIVSAAAAMSLLVAFIALVKVRDQQRHRDWGMLLVVVVVGIALAATLNPIANARYTFGTAALAVATLFGVLATRRRFRIMAVLAVVALILVFPMADAFRYSAQGEIKTASPLESFTSPDYDAFAQINNTVLYVDRVGSTNGKQALGVVLFWVPRHFWPDKPTDTGILLADSRGYKFTNLSSPLWAELFINGGWPALVVGMVGLGVVTRRSDAEIDAALQRERSPGVLACILPFYLLILLRGSLLQAMSSLLVILCCGLFVLRPAGVARAQ